MWFERRAAVRPDAMAEELVDQRVDAADEEAGDRGDVVHRRARCQAPFQAPQPGFGYGLVAVDREQQRDVDVDAFEQQLLDRRQSLHRAGDLDHEVRPVDQRREVSRLRDGTLRVAREVR